MRRTTILLVGLTALLAACGGDETEETTGATGSTAATGATATGATGETGEGCVDLTGEGATFTIAMGDDFFEPACFTASASQGITIVNEGISLHSFTMKGTMVDVDVQPGDTFNGEPIAGVVEPGTYDLVCKYHEAQGMVGEVTVVE